MRFVNLSIILFSTICTVCDTNRVFEDTKNFANAYWLADSVKYFEFQIPEHSQEYNILLSIRNGRDYPHNNLYVQYQIQDSARQVLDKELRNFQLFHQKSGYLLGKGSGNIYEHDFDLLSSYQFPYTGKFYLRVEQYMRYDSLPEMYSVGLRIERPMN